MQILAEGIEHGDAKFQKVIGGTDIVKTIEAYVKKSLKEQTATPGGNPALELLLNKIPEWAGQAKAKKEKDCPHKNFMVLLYGLEKAGVTFSSRKQKLEKSGKRKVKKLKVVEDAGKVIENRRHAAERRGGEAVQ